MKRTGPTKESTRALAVFLEKCAKKSGKKIWKVLAEEISKPARKKQCINLWKLDRMSKSAKHAVFATGSKILSLGEVSGKITIICPDCSAKAREKIEAKGGKVILLSDDAALGGIAGEVTLVK